MCGAKTLWVVVFVAAAVGAGPRSDAAVPPTASPSTLWQFLGIPQGIHKIRDATSNKRGNNPQKERKPPLKRIADPANLESQNPAIKAAAKVKSEEDLAPQKVKAIKYLATIGCGCYPGVREALLAALDDCTEEVRYQAAVAFCQAAGTPCQHCDRSGCCNAAVMTKLEELAHGQDDNGCCKETSPRVRAAAENALNACRQRIPPSAEPATQPAPKKELPTEPTPAPLPSPPEKPVPGMGERTSASVKPVSMTGFVEVGDEDETEAGYANAVALAGRCPRGYRSGRCPPCPSETIIQSEPCPPPSAPSTAAPGATAPGTAEAEAAAPGAAAPSPSALAGNYGAAAGPMSSAPNMIGDSFGSGGGGASFVQAFTFDNLLAQETAGGFYTVRQDGTRVALNGPPGPTNPDCAFGHSVSGP